MGLLHHLPRAVVLPSFSLPPPERKLQQIQQQQQAQQQQEQQEAEAEAQQVTIMSSSGHPTPLAPALAEIDADLRSAAAQKPLAVPVPASPIKYSSLFMQPIVSAAPSSAAAAAPPEQPITQASEVTEATGTEDEGQASALMQATD